MDTGTKRGCWQPLETTMWVLQWKIWKKKKKIRKKKEKRKNAPDRHGLVISERAHT